MNASDWQGARNDFKTLLQNFPEDNYSRGRLAAVEAKIAEQAQLEQQSIQRANEEQQSRKKIADLRLAALNSYRQGSYQKSISELQEYLKFEPNSDEAYFYLGGFYRWNDAVNVVARFEYNSVGLGLSYDSNVSSLSNSAASTSAIEINFTYVSLIKLGQRARHYNRMPKFF